MSKQDQIGNMRGLYLRIRSKIAAALAAAKSYTDSAVAAIEPDHTIANDSSLGKLVLTVTESGQQKQYAILRQPIVKPAAPTITAGANFYNSKTITITAESEATIRYAMTSDGSTPTTPTASTGTAYSAAFNIGSDAEYQTTYKIVAVAIKNGMVSDPTTVQTYVCTRRVDIPAIAIGGSKYDSERTVTLTQSAADSIMYRLGDSGDFSTYDSTNKPKVTTSGQKVYAYSVKDGWANSTTAESDAVTLNAKKCYIGRSSGTTISAISSLSDLKGFEVDKFAKNTDYSNTFTAGGRIWFIVPSAQTITKVTSGGYLVPVELVANQISGYNCYRRVEDDLAGTYTYNFE